MYALLHMSIRMDSGKGLVPQVAICEGGVIQNTGFRGFFSKHTLLAARLVSAKSKDTGCIFPHMNSLCFVMG